MEIKYNFFEIFAAKIISDSNILFVMPFICQIDMNGYLRVATIMPNVSVANPNENLNAIKEETNTQY